MLIPIGGLQQTTNYRVVIPFYAYASISFIVGTILLLLHTSVLKGHYFNPKTLAIVHTMALGWGTMIILGASHQLLPVLIESKLDSDPLAYLTLGSTAIGIPLLVYGFYTFQLGLILQIGAVLVNVGVGLYVVNVFVSAFKGVSRNVHAWFMMAASLWLLSTTFFGMLLVFNFTKSVLNEGSVYYLSLHAHMGLMGWFLMMVFGVGSRLIPMFLISKYKSDRTLWWVFGLLNASLISFVLFKLMEAPLKFYCFTALTVLAGITLFGHYCYHSYKVRIRKAVDEQMKTSLFSVAQMLLPVLIMIYSIAVLPDGATVQLATLYGFCILFGWITAIILGMTFKTLPFIVWNVVYYKKAHKGKTPAPKDLFHEKIYRGMQITYLLGFVVFALGLLFKISYLLQGGAVLLLLSALLYTVNTGKIIFHQPTKL